MVLSEYGARRGKFDFSILATDISTRVLAQAQEATYSQAVAAAIPPALRKRYLLSIRDPARR